MESKLPTECLLQILENFGPTYNEWDDSFKSLHACILVNRKWCEAGLTILWREPIEWLHSKEHNRSRLAPLISIYISCLPQGSKSQISDGGLELSSSTLKSVSIDYPSLLKGLDYQSLYNAIGFWMNANDIPEDEIFREEMKNQVLEFIYEMFMARCKILKRFSIFMKAGYILNEYYLLQLPFASGADQSLSNITEFSCKACLFSQFMYLVAQICRNIKRFNIECCCTDNGGLAKLIEIQEVPLDCILINLKSKNIPLVENAIRKKSHSVTDVRLFGYDILLDYFKE
ncbi:8917_t:CDS:1, partial [Funneliformis caledonium]